MYPNTPIIQGKNTAEMPKRICAVYGGSTVTNQRCQKWFVKVSAGDFSLNDVLWSCIDQWKLIPIKSRH